MRRLKYILRQEGPAFLVVLLGVVVVASFILFLCPTRKSSFGSKNSFDAYLNGLISKQIEKAKVEYKNSNGKN